MMRLPYAMLLGASLFSLPGSARAREIQEGSAFPDLRLPQLGDGKLRSLSEFRGRKTLLLVFASW